MDIYDVLEHEHRRILDLVEKAKRAFGPERDELVAQILDELSLHAAAEEVVLYDRLIDVEDAYASVRSAIAEHHGVSQVLSELDEGGLSPAEVGERVYTLSAQLARHIDAEEHALFAQAEDALDDEVAEALAGEFLATKEQLSTQSVSARISQTLAHETEQEEHEKQKEQEALAASSSEART